MKGVCVGGRSQDRRDTLGIKGQKRHGNQKGMTKRGNREEAGKDARGQQ